MTTLKPGKDEDIGAWFAHGDVRVYYEVTGDGPAALILPGLAGSIDEFVAFRDLIVASGMRAIAADLPGSGRSEPQPRIYAPNYHEEDAATFADLIEHLNAAPVLLIGFSDGGDVGLLLAAMYPELARGLFAWGAMGSIEDPDGEVAEFFRVVVDNPLAGGERFSAWLIDTYGRERARASMQSVADALAAIAARGGDISGSRAQQIVCPVLLVAGDEDRFVPTATLIEYSARLPNGRVQIVEGGAHSLHLSHPQLMAERLQAFVRTLPDLPETEQPSAKS